MNARNNVKRLFYQNLDARPLLAAAQQRLAARVDYLVARWLQRCAADVEAAQRWFDTDRKPSRELRLGARLAASSARWDEAP